MLFVFVLCYFVGLLCLLSQLRHAELPVLLVLAHNLRLPLEPARLELVPAVDPVPAVARPARRETGASDGKHTNANQSTQAGTSTHTRDTHLMLKRLGLGAGPLYSGLSFTPLASCALRCFFIMYSACHARACAHCSDGRPVECSGGRTVQTRKDYRVGYYTHHRVVRADLLLPHALQLRVALVPVNRLS